MGQINIKLTSAAPVTVDAKTWPVIASAKWWDGQHECQANRTRRVTVRQHEDGRSVVYGWHTSAWPGERGAEAGYLVAADGDLIAAIRTVGEEIGDTDLARECIQDLPRVELV